jgi:tetratricopeptide (TPR) repeat protein
MYCSPLGHKLLDIDATGSEMTRESWYRNSDWNAGIEASFFAKLARAKNKAQYVRIQASLLGEKHPAAALRLLDQYFDLGDHFDLAQAHVDRATALLSAGDVEGAVGAYEAALSTEARRPNVQTYAYLDLPLLIAMRKDALRFPRALELLERGASRLMFAADHFRWHAAKSLIANALSNSDEARKHAQIALAAASRTNSGFRYHPDVGLVGDKYAGLRRELALMPR